MAALFSVWVPLLNVNSPLFMEPIKLIAVYTNAAIDAVLYLGGTDAGIEKVHQCMSDLIEMVDAIEPELTRRHLLSDKYEVAAAKCAEWAYHAILSGLARGPPGVHGPFSAAAERLKLFIRTLAIQNDYARGVAASIGMDVGTIPYRM